VRYKITASKPVVFKDDHYFRHRFVTDCENYCLNISRAHWMICDECRIKWLIGENLFSSWRKENKDL
jgi:hypothetical protein